MLADKPLHDKWKQRFGGVNQAAFGFLTDEHSPYIGSIMPSINEVPCTTWNCEHDCLKRELFGESTRVVHINGNLRRVLFNREQANNRTISNLAAVWRQFEAEAKGVAA
jgi:hypothetical protein